MAVVRVFLNDGSEPTDSCVGAAALLRLQGERSGEDLSLTSRKSVWRGVRGVGGAGGAGGGAVSV